jgi:CO dehydrogenase nickel-insertion accessory protein CooC1
MIVGVLGKGGSGKSTISIALVEALLERENTVLALDADHNMDMALHFGLPAEGPCIGGSLPVLYAYHAQAHYKACVTAEKPKMHHLTPKDEYTSSITHQVSPRLYIAATGPQRPEVVAGHACSHTLATPLKAYLPLLHLEKDQWCVVDEKASVDAVTTGIPTGFDVALVVVENTLASIRTALAIAQALTEFEVPYYFVANKSTGDEDVDVLQKALGTPCCVTFPFVAPSEREATHRAAQRLVGELENMRSSVSGMRHARSQKKFT